MDENNIKHTPGPWHQDKWGNIKDSSGQSVRFGALTLAMANSDEVKANDAIACAGPDMAEVLEMIAADADAGEILMTSGIRLAIDAALIKAGRKAAPVREGE